MLDLVLPKFAEHADIGHLALIIVVGGLSAAWQMTFRELAAANRRFDTFVRELARFNQRLERDDP
jgi:hypothetical protein